MASFYSATQIKSYRYASIYFFDDKTVARVKQTDLINHENKIYKAGDMVLVNWRDEENSETSQLKGEILFLGNDWSDLSRKEAQWLEENEHKIDNEDTDDSSTTEEKIDEEEDDFKKIAPAATEQKDGEEDENEEPIKNLSITVAKVKNVKKQNLTKSMYQGSDIMFTIDCKGNDTDFLLSVLLFSQPCHEKDVSVIGLTQQISELSLKCHEKVFLEKDKLKKLVVEKLDISDSTPPDAIPNEPIQPNTVRPTQQTRTTAKNRKKKSLQEHIIVKRANTVGKVNKPTKAQTRKLRKVKMGKSTAKSIASKAPTKPTTVTKNVITNKPVAVNNVPVGVNVLPKTEFKAIYTLRLGFSGETKMKFHVKIESKHKGSYLSAINYPLLPFFGVMSLVYLAFAIGWFVVSCCNWRDLLRVQFWIGGVIALGMFENALFYTEYRNISSSGSENGLLYFAEIVSCIKRALARILVVIVSLGFGIVKPRLGETLHKVLAMGGLYFLLAAIEGCIRVHDSSKLVSKTQLYALVPLTALDVALCWWVFTALVQTTRTLRIRKNIVKLTLYRHFTNTLIFSVVASLAYMIWMIKQSRFTDCIDVSTIWMNDALWPFLFAIILLVIMVLWRPSINNQRYAFTPLDAGDSDGDDDMTLSDAFEGMKMRNKSDSHLNGSITKNRNKADDDLKWVEENIPSVPSTLLPTIDSDEEIIMTKFETSKMD